MTESAVHQWNPADYAAHSKGQEHWANELIELLALEANECVLDIGCGDGRHTAAIASRVPMGKVVGVDDSPEMVEFAREHFPATKFKNLAFLQADARDLPFEAEFDAVFSNAALHWVIDHKPVLAGIAKSLRPGGRCVLQMGGKGNGEEVIRALETCLSDARWAAMPSTQIPYGFYDAREYRGWLQKAGLQPDSVELIEKDMVHADAAAFTGWLRTAWLPYTTRVPEDCRDRFLQAVTDCYMATHPVDADGRVHVRMMRLQAVARKLP